MNIQYFLARTIGDGRAKNELLQILPELLPRPAHDQFQHFTFPEPQIYIVLISMRTELLAPAWRSSEFFPLSRNVLDHLALANLDNATSED